MMGQATSDWQEGSHIGQARMSREVRSQPVPRNRGGRGGLRLLLLSLGLTLGTGCGDNINAFLGTHDAQVTETITACNRANPLPSRLADVGEIEIVQGDYWDLFITVGPCELKSNIADNSALTFTIQEQGCTDVSLDDATAEITVSGQGQLSDDVLQITLSGTYEGTDNAGFPLTCTYGLQVN